MAQLEEGARRHVRPRQHPARAGQDVEGEGHIEAGREPVPWNGRRDPGAGAASEAGGGEAGAGSGAGSGAGAAEPGVTSTQQAVYAQAFNALKAGSYSVAISGFQGFLKQYPTSPLAPNAEYWLGQAHYVNQDFAAAEGDFQAVLDKWPNSSKAPAAMFDLGNTQLAQGKTAKGRTTLKQVVSQFPGTDAATRAQALLDKHAAK